LIDIGISFYFGYLLTIHYKVEPKPITMPEEPLLKKGFLVLLALLLSSFLNTSFAQSEQQKLKITKKYQIEKLELLSKKYAHQYNRQKQKAIQKAKQKGWIIRKELENGQVIELQSLTKDGKPLYFITNNINAANTISTDEVWNGGSAGLDLSGSGMTVGEWDGGGVLTSHQEFTDQGPSRVTQVDTPGSTNYHSTHVAGTMIAAGADTNAKGMAYEASLNAYDWNSDDSEMIDAALNGLLISNHSYGYSAGWYWDGSSWVWAGDENISSEEDYRFGFYGEYSARWDSIAYELPYYLIAKASGNDRGDGSGETAHPQDGGANGYDCIGYRGNAKNILTVGAIDDLPSGYTGNPADVTIADFSSRGPADDGRIKPDICGNGINLYSADNANDSSYQSINGTSMATPNVAGSLVLLQEHWYESQGNFMKSATLKGLVIHTANEAGDNDGPDYKFGWGVMNTQKAAEVISNNKLSAKITEDTLNEGSTYNISVDATGSEPLIVTICWTDPAGTPTSPQLDPSTPMLVNDLDLSVSDGSTTYFPYMLDPQNPSNAATTGDNNVDNVEKVVIESATQTTYNIEVTHEGSLTNGEQSFSMIISGISSDYPVVQTDSVYNITQTNADINAEVTDSGGSAVTNRGVVYSHNTAPTLNDSVIYSGSGIGSYSASITNLEPDTTYYARAFASNSAGTSYGNTIEFETDDYLPDVGTIVTSNITTNSADVESEVINNGGYTVNDRGFVYNTTTQPTLSDEVASSGSGTGTFSSTLLNLTQGTTYYVRAYATNSQGTSYGEELSFMTLCGRIDSLPYAQEFTTSALPNCWENNDNLGSGDIWAFNNPGDRSVDSINTTTVSNGFAILDSDYYGSGNSQDADLITPEFDLTHYDSITLYFEHVYIDYNSEIATLAYSTDGGSTWTNLQTWSGSDTEIPAIYNKDLTSEVATQSNVKFKWNYTGSFGWYWAVDDIHLSGVMLPTASIEAIPGCGSGNGSIRISSDKPGPQTFYLCDELGSTLQTWTGDTTAHTFTGLSDDNYTAKVEKNGNTSNLTSFVTLENSTNSPTEADSVNASLTDICEGSSTRLSYYGGTGNTFNWYANACGDTLVGTGNDLTVYPDSSTTYYGRWENACGESSCLSVSITVTQQPVAADTVTADSTTICNGESAVLSYAGGSGSSFEWYSNSCGGTAVGSGNDVTVTPTDTITYYGRWENSCDSSACKSVTVNVDPSSSPQSSVSASATTICEGESIELSYTGGSGAAFEWYSDSCGKNPVGSGNNLTVNPSATTTYFGRWESDCGNTVCDSVEVVVNPLPATQDSVSATAKKICNGTSTELSYSGGSGDNFVWYTGSCGNNQFATGNNISITPDSTTTFYGRWENSCGVSECDSITIQVDPLPGPPSSVNASLTTICEGGNIRLSYSGGSGGSFEWYSGSCGGTHVGSGNDLTVTPTTSTTYYGRWESNCGNTSCKSIEVTVNPLPDAPTSVSASSQSILVGESIELSYSGGSGDTFEWYSGSCGDTSVGSGNNISVSPTSTTTFYGRWENSCGESQCSSVTVEVEQKVTAPSSLSATEDTICEGSSTRLSYSGGSGETFRWFAGSCGGTSIGTGNDLTITSTGTTTYYGRWENSYGASECKSITITVDHGVDGPRSVESSFTSICQGTTTRLSYEGGTGSIFKWYTGSCGGTYLGEGNNLTVNPTKNTVYYGRWENTCGVSFCDSVKVSVKDSTEITQHPEDKQIATGDRTTFSVEAKGSNLLYTWRKDGSELSDGAGYSGTSTRKLTIDPVDTTHEGSYDVVITGDCGSKTSYEAMLTIGATAIAEAPAEHIQIYPNPTSGKITIRGEHLNGAELTIMNLLGKQIIRQKMEGNKDILDLRKHPKGIYFVKIELNKTRVTKKIIVE